MTSIILGIFEESLVYAHHGLGVCTSHAGFWFFRIYRWTEPSFGAAFTATGSLPEVSSIGWALPSLLPWGHGSYITGLIHVRLRYGALLSGIIVMTALFTHQSWVVGKFNLPIFSKDTIFQQLC